MGFYKLVNKFVFLVKAQKKNIYNRSYLLDNL